jgi:hypothetical protein
MRTVACLLNMLRKFKVIRKYLWILKYMFDSIDQMRKKFGSFGIAK